MPVKVTYKNEKGLGNGVYDNYFDSYRGAKIFVDALDEKGVDYNVGIDVPWPGGDQ